ncbi:class I SAM-dependent methyltransferase [Solirubrobacter taibaiensis]|nr:class I SAM-dependent methyltransferase [Solirubrobacter taibaiensis]
MSSAPATYEDIVDGVVATLHQKGALATAAPAPWGAFLRMSNLVHEQFEIPSTTITPIMRRVLFGLGCAARAANVVGVGTFVGYALAWLVRDRDDPSSAPFAETAYAIEIDAEANRVARRNCALLNHGPRLSFADADGTVPASYPVWPIDLLYLDLDDAHERKAGYVHALEAAGDRLRSGALVLAHDPCVPQFAESFAAYHEYVRTSDRLCGPWILPVDECGLSVASAV